MLNLFCVVNLSTGAVKIQTVGKAIKIPIPPARAVL